MTIPSKRYLDFVSKAGPAPAYSALYDEYYRDPELFDEVVVDEDNNVIIDLPNGFIMIGES